ncbi:hypothetical protein T484DRAFT_1794681 [Baffinella frigidus]|nr:hypothetical protein T484DRAFT_1794681 [Cryptophyta sp. CCMP2293]
MEEDLFGRDSVKSLAHLFLDTLTYNAHTSAADALAAAVPLLSLPGSSMPSRVAASILLAARSPQGFRE